MSELTPNGKRFLTQLSDGQLPKTDAGINVLAVVLLALDETDARWKHGGTPSVTDYARSVSKALRKKFLDGECA